MKNVKFLVVSCLLLLSTATFGQSSGEIENGPACESCEDPLNLINDIGTNKFATGMADKYYWVKCNGLGNIVGSNTNQEVNVSGPVGYTFSLHLTTFKDGKCKEACKTFTYEAPLDLKTNAVLEQMETRLITMQESDEKGPGCSTCNDPKNYINDNGNNTLSTSTLAQGYYWQVCNGPGSISTGRRGQTVTVSGPAGSTSNIILTMFINGKCVEACQSFTIPQTRDCDGCAVLNVTGNSTGENCTEAYGYLGSACDQTDIMKVDWYWSLIHIQEELTHLSTTYTAPFFSDTLTLSGYSLDIGVNPDLSFEARITYNDNSTCKNHDYEFLQCDNMNGGGFTVPNTKVSLNPNPLKTGTEVSFEGMEVESINTLEIFDIYGNQKISMKPSKQSISVRDLTTGIYIVRFNKTSGEVIQKKLIIE